MELSLVVPVFNGAAYIADTVTALRRFLDQMNVEWELLVVDDGSTDTTAATVEEMTGDRVRRLSLDHNRGKFAALKVGMTSVQGRCRIFTDADLPYDLDAIPYIAEQVAGRGIHMVVGDRSLAESELRTTTSPLRRLTTHSYSFLVRMLVTGGLFDTQCGLKGLRGDVADALFPLLVDDGFSGDVELLYVALKYNLEIKRIPVRLQRAAPSTVRMATDAASMLLRIVGLRRRWVTGRYGSEQLAEIAGQRYWDR